MAKKFSLVFIITILFITSLPSIAYGSTASNRDVEIPVLMYHHFVEGTPPQGTEGAIMDINLFREQLIYLQEKGFHAISLSHLQDYLTRGRPLPPNPFVITIDDGYESNYTLAYPVLQELNMPANINIVVSSRGKTPGVHAHFTWEEAQEMLDSGLIEIGSHTYDLHDEHIKRLPGESPEVYRDRIYRDFKLSRYLIQEHLGIEPFIYCPPYGIFDSISQSIAKDLGFTLQITTRPGVVTKDSNILELNRIAARGDESPEELLEKIFSYMKHPPRNQQPVEYTPPNFDDILEIYLQNQATPTPKEEHTLENSLSLLPLLRSISGVLSLF